MSKQSLRERYEAKQASKSLLQEQLILEKFNKETMMQATQIVKSLKSIDFKDLKSLASARDAAVGDALKVVSGQSNQGIIRKIIGLFKKGGENPLVDVLAFSDAIHSFFEDFAPWLESMGAGNPNASDSSVQTLITGISPEQADAGEASEEADDESKEKLQDLQKLIMKGLQPDGVLANVGKSWKKKYFKNNYQQFAQEIMRSNVGEIMNVAKSVIESLSNAQAVGQSAAGAQDVAGRSTQGTTGPEQAKASQPTSGSAPSEKSVASVETGSSPETSQQPDKIINDAVDIMKKLVVKNNLDVPDAYLEIFAKLLYKAKKLK